MKTKKETKQKPRKNRYVCTRCSAQFTLKERILQGKKCPICGGKKVLREDKYVKGVPERNVKVRGLGPIGVPDRSDWNLPDSSTRTRRGLDAKNAKDN